MINKSVPFSALIALAISAFAADPSPKPAPTLESLIPQLAAPLGKDTFQRQNELEKLAANAGRPGAGGERAQMAEALCSAAADTKLPYRVRSLLLSQVMRIGGAESVDPLAKLLADADPNIRETVRRALENNPSAKAGAVLRDELKKGGDLRWQIGLINSLGRRRDSDAVEAIIEKLAKPETAFAATEALGEIATPAAITALQQAFPANAAAGSALIMAAQRLHAEGKNAEAAAICSGIYSAPAAPSLRAAALDVLATTDADQARKLIPAALASDEVRLQTAAFSAALALSGTAGVTAELAPQLAQLKTPVKLAALRVMNASAEDQIIALANDPDPDVRDAAITALGRVGSAASVPVLLRIANNTARELTPVGAALSTVNGPGAEEAIQKAAASGDPKSRAFAITVLGWRASKSAAPTLVKYAAEANPAISRAACNALRSAGSEAEMMPMIQLVMGGKVPNAASAVRGISARMSNRKDVAVPVINMAKASTGKERIRTFEILSLVGGSEALQTLVGYTRSADPEVSAGAVSALCKWPEFDGVDALLAIGADPKVPEPRRILALHAVEGIILSAIDESPARRVDAALRLLKTATRDEEKGLALSVLASIPNRAAAKALLPLIADARLKELACIASLNLADALANKRDNTSARNLALAVQKAAPAEALSKRAQEILVRTSKK